MNQQAVNMDRTTLKGVMVGLFLFSGTLLVACGPHENEQGSCSDWPSEEERVACVFTEQKDVYSLEDFRAFCQTDCNALQDFRVWNGAVDNLDPLAPVVTIERNFWLDGMNTGADLSGARNMVSVGKESPHQTNFMISATHLRSVSGFDSLRTVYGAHKTAFEISGNHKLEVLSFPRLTSIEGGIFIFRNAQLQDLSGLSKLESVSGNLVVWDNPKLPTCEVQAFVEQVDVGGEVSLRGNGSGQCD